MSDFAELGPLDVQIYMRDEIGERRSGLLYKSALNSLSEDCNRLFGELLLSLKTNSAGLVRFKLASEVAERIAIGLFSPIYGQISPEALGQDYQDLNVAFEYGIRLVRVSKLASPSAVHRLVNKYPSHDFIIDKMEAREILKRVDDPTRDMYMLVVALGELGFQPDRRRATIRTLTPTKSGLTSDEARNVEDAAEESPGNGEHSSETGNGGDATVDAVR
jgi:hypothetical protein